jgi:hypothetical protein
MANCVNGDGRNPADAGPAVQECDATEADLKYESW